MEKLRELVELESASTRQKVIGENVAQIYNLTRRGQRGLCRAFLRQGSDSELHSQGVEKGGQAFEFWIAFWR